MSKHRKIIHVDMDAFFAAVEQRDFPEYRGKPIVVGASPQSRGVVCTASYEARVFGIHSAMPCSQAFRLCPNALFVKPRFNQYRECSNEIFSIFRSFTEMVEPLSLDEAYLDVTSNFDKEPSATLLARKILRQIHKQTKLTASAGVAPNKFLAKLASDMDKPCGLSVISPDRVSEVLATLAVGKIPGVGKVTEKRMHELGIWSTRDLRRKSEKELCSIFGKHGQYYYHIARGEDERPVLSTRTRKSIGCEDTFAQDILKLERLEEELIRIARKATLRAEKKGFSGKTITLKVTYSDFHKVTRSKTLEQPICSLDTIEEIALSLLKLTEAGRTPIRLLGLSFSNALPTDSQKKLQIEQYPMQLALPFTADSV